MKIKITRKAKVITIIIVLLISSFSFIAFTDKEFKIAKNLDIFFTLFRELNLFYVDETDPEELIEAGIDGMLKSLDPYTTYIPESEMDNFNFMTTGQYGGIGALIRKAGDYSMITEPYVDFPAYKAGLRAGDTIISIDGISIKDKKIVDVSEMLKGTPNTSLKLEIKRYGQETTIEKTLSREIITIKNIPYYGMVDDNIGYIRLSNFTNNAGKEAKEALNALKKQNAHGIVLDLRGNPGGLLIESVNVANLFVNQGREIVSTHGKVKQWDNVYKTTQPAIDTTIALVVLVNRGSASASEIVAGSLQDLDRGVIVGEKTFGKGLVQTTRPLSYNTQLKVTTAKYYIPSGRCIQAVDYAHRNEDGSVGYIPDSLINEFTTRNGRKVYDGGGITPDVKVDTETPGNITISLFAKNLIFDYATIFVAEKDLIENIEDYEFADDDYREFLKFLEDKDIDYTTQSWKSLEELIKTTKKEKYYVYAEEEFTALKQKLAHDKNKDLQTFKDEIIQLLMEEIASRYDYQEGRIKVSLRNDIQFEKAISILKNKEQYLSILRDTGNNNADKAGL
jgi:carboxyl-terminal processing protease